MISDFRGRRVTVMGLGSFGGGIGVVQFLLAQGAKVMVTDLKPAEDLADSLTALGEPKQLDLHLGGHQDRDFRDADLIVASPAVPRESRYLQIARDADVPITSEMNIFWERNRGRTVCVTGSNGKSTTAAMIAALLSAISPATGLAPQSAASAAAPGAPLRGPHRPGAAPRSSFVSKQEAEAAKLPAASPRHVWLGGNIGKSLLTDLDSIKPDDWVVLELSSFQLDDLAPLCPNPHVAVVTNFSPNHLDRHDTFEAYRAAKQNILRWQTPDRLAVLNQNDPDVAGWPTAARKLWFGREDEGRQGMFAVGFDAFKRRALFRQAPREQVLPLGQWLAIPGVHNFMNALAATCTALALGGTPADVEAGLMGFKGLPHRLQFVCETAGRKFYNDSKATTPESTLLAIDAFRAPIVLLAGGYDKGIDLSELVRGIVARKVKALALLGQTAEALKTLLREADPRGEVEAKVHVTLEGAFQWAAAQSAAGDTVLLSPGCASYDWFSNYEARGNEFVRLATAWRPAE